MHLMPISQTKRNRKLNLLVVCVLCKEENQALAIASKKNDGANKKRNQNHLIETINETILDYVTIKRKANMKPL